MGILVDQIDHAELTVPDRYEAASWYESVLGLKVLPEYAFWAEDPAGPLMIGTVHGGTKLALFEGSPIGSKRTVGFHLIAFRVSGPVFRSFLTELDSLQLVDQNGQIVAKTDYRDHSSAFSIYFCDPWGHQLEITTYDHHLVRNALDSNH